MRQACSFVSRRTFVKGLPGLTVVPAAAGAAAAGLAGVVRAEGGVDAPAVHAEFPAQDPALVREVVGVSHGNYERVRELVEASPALAKAAWDWGFGDWEGALGAAAHTGSRKIAELLIAHGARPNLFSAAMLGQLEVVRAYVDAYSGGPPVQRTPGPHGITLLSHARSGGEPAQPVVEYLESVGEADVGQTNEPLDDEQKQAYLGTYAYGAAADERFDIILSRDGMLAFKRGDYAMRRLLHAGAHTFHPSGAASVRVVFGFDGETARMVTVHDPDPIVIATRV